MKYRSDKKGNQISQLGYGCMRFTKKGGAVDLDKAEKEMPFGVFREGDKVMQTRNNYELDWHTEGMVPEKRGMGIFNGDIGFIREINGFTQTLRIEFDDRRFVDYPFAALEDLELSYAITVHKSQGSEYPAVVLPLFGGPEMLMSRNLLYTGVTRARKCVCIVGRFDTFARMIKNARVTRRYSGLREKILKAHESY